MGRGKASTTSSTAKAACQFFTTCIDTNINECASNQAITVQYNRCMYIVFSHPFDYYFGFIFMFVQRIKNNSVRLWSIQEIWAHNFVRLAQWNLQHKHTRTLTYISIMLHVDTSVRFHPQSAIQFQEPNLESLSFRHLHQIFNCMLKFSGIYLNSMCTKSLSQCVFFPYNGYKNVPKWDKKNQTKLPKLNEW